MSVFATIRNGIVNNKYQLGYGVVDWSVNALTGKVKHRINTRIHLAQECIRNPELKEKIQKAPLDNVDKKMAAVWKRIAANPKKELLKERALDVVITGVRVLPTLGLAVAATTVTGLLGPAPVVVIVMTPVIGKLVHLAISAAKPGTRVFEPVDKVIEFSYDFVKLGVVFASKLTGTVLLKDAAFYFASHAALMGASKIANYYLLRKVSEQQTLVTHVFSITLVGATSGFHDNPFFSAFQAIASIVQPFLERYKFYSQNHKDRLKNMLQVDIEKIKKEHFFIESTVRRKETCDTMEDLRKKLSEINDDDPLAVEKMRLLTEAFSKTLEENVQKKLDTEIETDQGLKKCSTIVAFNQARAEERFKPVEARKWMKRVVEERKENPNCENASRDNTAWYVEKVVDLSYLIDRANSSEDIFAPLEFGGDILIKAEEMVEMSQYHLSNRTDEEMIQYLLPIVEKFV